MMGLRVSARTSAAQISREDARSAAGRILFDSGAVRVTLVTNPFDLART